MILTPFCGIAGIYDLLLAQLFIAKPCLIQTARRHAIEIFSNQRIIIVHGKSLLCQQDFTTRLVRNTAQQF